MKTTVIAVVAVALTLCVTLLFVTVVFPVAGVGQNESGASATKLQPTAEPLTTVQPINATTDIVSPTSVKPGESTTQNTVQTTVKLGESKTDIVSSTPVKPEESTTENTVQTTVELGESMTKILYVTTTELPNRPQPIIWSRSPPNHEN